MVKDYLIKNVNLDHQANYVLTLRHSSHTHLNLYTSDHKARLAESKKRKKVVRRDLFASLSLR